MKRTCQDKPAIDQPARSKRLHNLLQSNQTEAARQHAEALLAQHPDNWDVLLIAHRAQRRCGRHQQALAIALRLIEQNPGRADGYARGAQDRLLLNQPQQALSSSRRGNAALMSPIRIC